MSILQPTPETCAIVELGRYDSPDHVLCAQCRQIKPVHSFIRRATKTQAISWGYEGNYLLKYVSSTCLSCKPQPKPLHQLPTLQIKQRLSTGNYTGSTARAEEILTKKKERGVEGIRNGIKKRMKNTAAEKWKDITEELTKHITLFRQQLNTMEKNETDAKSRSSLSTSFKPNPSRRSPQRMAYTKLILDTALATRNIIKNKIAYGEKPSPTTTRWQHLLTDEQRQNIQAHYDAIPPEEARKMRHTAVLNLTEYSDYIHYAPKKD